MVEAGFPKEISKSLTGTPTAGIVNPNEFKTYLFKGTKFWVFDEESQEFEIAREPVSSRFDGIPNNISGGFVDANGE